MRRCAPKIASPCAAPTIASLDARDPADRRDRRTCRRASTSRRTTWSTRSPRRRSRPAPPVDKIFTEIRNEVGLSVRKTWDRPRRRRWATSTAPSRTTGRTGLRRTSYRFWGDTATVGASAGHQPRRGGSRARTPDCPTAGRRWSARSTPYFGRLAVHAGPRPRSVAQVSAELEYLDGFQAQPLPVRAEPSVTRSCPEARAGTSPTRRAPPTTSPTSSTGFAAPVSLLSRQLGASTLTWSRGASTSALTRNLELRAPLPLCTSSRRRTSGATDGDNPAATARARSCTPRDPKLGPVSTSVPEIKLCGTLPLGVVPFFGWFAGRQPSRSPTGATSKTPASATPTCSRPATRCHTEGHGSSERGPTLRQVRAARLAGAPTRGAIIQVLLGSVFLVGRAGLRARPGPSGSGRTSLWMTGLLVLSTADVGVGLRTLARARPPSPRSGGSLAAPPGACLSTLLVGFLLQAAQLTHGITASDRTPDACSSRARRRASGAPWRERFAARGWRVFARMRRPEGGGPVLRARPRTGLEADDARARRHPRRLGRRAVARAPRETERAPRRARQQRRLLRLGPAGGDVARRAARPAGDQRHRRARVTRAVLPAMRARRTGTVVTIGRSPGGWPCHGRALPRLEVGARGDDRGLRLRAHPFGVRVALVEPGPFVTRAAHQRDSARRPPAPPTALTPRCWPPTGGNRPGCARATSPRLIDVIERAATSPPRACAGPSGPTSFSGGGARLLPRLALRMARCGSPSPSAVEGAAAIIWRRPLVGLAL